ncbi:hypothetical protein ST201phi2-1p330 [Pseudomonas phage 201phi2-1]|uniref:Uncharacterized protein n=1 Tax=Pseudomonas phage 201phi2-1 TaxID=198110 RepID=B3FJJ0_BP201|nr:hypothetical protein ST201phi2-1p330 [Pseudomonas phage 201phi2-1]ABY63155.1 hypothetical protein 201phi2-1p330 [Pseudomonas phage 201phi2-1]
MTVNISHKFPHDYDEDEYIESVKNNPSTKLFDEHDLRTDYRLRKAGVAGLLEEAGRYIKDLVTSDGELTVEKVDFDNFVNQRLGSVASALDGNMPSTRWVVLDYQFEVIKDPTTGKVELLEETRPVGSIATAYWDLVNG